MHQRDTVVCRNKNCKGGGWWGKEVPKHCPNCFGFLNILAPTIIISLKEG